MTYTMEDFVHQFVKEHFAQLSPEEQREALKRLSPEHRREFLQSLSAEDRREILRSLPPEERLAGLSVEDLLANLSEEAIRQLRDQLASDHPAQSPRRRRKK